MVRNIKKKHRDQNAVTRKSRYYDAYNYVKPESPNIGLLLKAINIISFYAECVWEIAARKIDRKKNIQKAFLCIDEFRKLVKRNKNNGIEVEPQSLNEFITEAEIINAIIKKYLNPDIEINMDESSLLYSKLYKIRYLLSQIREELK